MGWYNRIINHTLQTYSTHPYKYGRCSLDQILKDEPTWSMDHIIVGGGQEGYYLINGYLQNGITNTFDEYNMFAIDYKVIPLDETLTECEQCNVLLCGDIFVVANKKSGMWQTPDMELVHCANCHNIWDGCAQCPCMAED